MKWVFGHDIRKESRRNLFADTEFKAAKNRQSIFSNLSLKIEFSLKAEFIVGEPFQIEKKTNDLQVAPESFTENRLP